MDPTASLDPYLKPVEATSRMEELTKHIVGFKTHFEVCGRRLPSLEEFADWVRRLD